MRMEEDRDQTREEQNRDQKQLKTVTIGLDDTVDSERLEVDWNLTGIYLENDCNSDSE